MIPLTERLPLSNYHFMRRRVKRLHPRTALDIGSGYGDYVEMMNDMGIWVWGLDPMYPDGVFTFQGSFPDEIPTQILRRTYPLITMNEVIYYFKDLDAALSHAKSLLNPGGHIMIKSYNGHSTLPHHAGDTATFIPYPENVKASLEKAGFEIVEMVPYPDDYFRMIEITASNHMDPKTAAKLYNDHIVLVTSIIFFMDLISPILNRLYWNIPALPKKWIDVADRFVITAKVKP